MKATCVEVMNTTEKKLPVFFDSEAAFSLVNCEVKDTIWWVERSPNQGETSTDYLDRIDFWRWNSWFEFGGCFGLRLEEKVVCGG